jgi:hypothetical protein
MVRSWRLFSKTRLTDTGIASPLYLRHPVGNYIELEGPIVTDSAFFVL